MTGYNSHCLFIVSVQVHYHCSVGIIGITREHVSQLCHFCVWLGRAALRRACGHKDQVLMGCKVSAHGVHPIAPPWCTEFHAAHNMRYGNLQLIIGSDSCGFWGQGTPLSATSILDVLPTLARLPADPVLNRAS